MEVSQFLRLDFDPMFVNERLAEIVRNAKPPDYTRPDEPHGVLADLPISIYITTNFDDFMFQALRDRNKDPQREICRWSKYLRERVPSVFEEQPDFKPTPDTPLVFHLYGHSSFIETLVLAEDDYFDFLWQVAAQKTLLPQPVREALSSSSLLFIGYALRDSTFRTLLRGMMAEHPFERRMHVSQQLLPWMDASVDQERLKRDMGNYFSQMNIRVFWGDIATFAGKLRQLHTEISTKRSASKDYGREPIKSIDENVRKPVPRVFISYAREDASRAQGLYQELLKAGFRPWMDKNDILGGEQWQSSIRKAIQGSDFFIACLSNIAATKRGYLQREFKEALELWQEKLESDIYLIPVRFDDCEVPDKLKDFQWLDLFDETGLAKLIESIKVGLRRRHESGSS